MTRAGGVMVQSVQVEEGEHLPHVSITGVGAADLFLRGVCSLCLLSGCVFYKPAKV